MGKRASRAARLDGVREVGGRGEFEEEGLERAEEPVVGDVPVLYGRKLVGGEVRSNGAAVEVPRAEERRVRLTAQRHARERIDRLEERRRAAASRRQEERDVARAEVALVVGCEVVLSLAGAGGVCAGREEKEGGS